MEASFVGDFDNAHVFAGEQLFGHFDSVSVDIFYDGEAGSFLELFTEVAIGDIGIFGEGVEADFFGEFFVDIAFCNIDDATGLGVRFDQEVVGEIRELEGEGAEQGECCVQKDEQHPLHSLLLPDLHLLAVRRTQRLLAL